MATTLQVVGHQCWFTGVTAFTGGIAEGRQKRPVCSVRPRFPLPVFLSSMRAYRLSTRCGSVPQCCSLQALVIKGSERISNGIW